MGLDTGDRPIRKQMAGSGTDREFYLGAPGAMHYHAIMVLKQEFKWGHKIYKFLCREIKQTRKLI